MIVRIAATLLVAVTLLGAPLAMAQTPPHDGSRDFDWEIGDWQTQVRVRAPLSTAESWAEFRGVSIVHPLSQSRANTVDLNVASGERRIEGVSLRLFNPQTQQWSINFASMRDGALTAPLYGGFAAGRGVFYGQDNIDGRVVLVRFVISDITRNSARFEQAYSADGGQTWIVNWIAVDTRTR
jgi:hypothetical protein